MQKILIVDDDPVMLRLASMILSKHFQIVTALSGAEALNVFEAEKPDLVLSDLLMPEMDGYELHRILQERNSESVPIVFMTADENEDSERRGFDIGVDDYFINHLRRTFCCAGFKMFCAIPIKFAVLNMPLIQIH